MIPARVRSEWSGPRKKGFSSIWAPASQDSCHVGNASVGVLLVCVVLLWLCLPLLLLSSSLSLTARAVRCVLPLGLDRFMHLVFFFFGRVSRC